MLERGDPSGLAARRREILALRGVCLGCASCAGTCKALIEVLVLPDMVLREKEA